MSHGLPCKYQPARVRDASEAIQNLESDAKIYIDMHPTADPDLVDLQYISEQDLIDYFQYQHKYLRLVHYSRITEESENS